MRSFGLAEAQHYCTSYVNTSGPSQGSFKGYWSNYRPTSSVLREGTTEFVNFQACSLRDVERSLYIAASNYRRCLDLLVPSASWWSHVTTYYGTFHAARALLGMFGCTVFEQHVVDVKKNSPGNQELEIRRIGNSSGNISTTYRGTHQRFWDFFYRATLALRPQVPAHLAIALSPVSGDHTWLIQTRNDINYDTYSALKLVYDFQSSFSPASFPASLPGQLATQFGIFECLVELTFTCARRFNLNTDALANVNPTGLRLCDLIHQQIYELKTSIFATDGKRIQLFGY